MCAYSESRFLGMECTVGGKSHVRINMSVRTVANKYHEGKMKRTLNRVLQDIESVEW